MWVEVEELDKSSLVDLKHQEGVDRRTEIATSIQDFRALAAIIRLDIATSILIQKKLMI